MRSYTMENIPSEIISGESKSFWTVLALRLRAVFSKVNIQRRPRHLKLCETLSLGDKRILALVECENQRFLLAATAHSVSLIQTLDIGKEKDESQKPSL